MNEKDIVSGNKVILSKKHKNGSIYLVEFPNNLYIVIGTNNKEIICSRSFPYSKKYQKEIKREATDYFKKVKECYYQNKLQEIDEL